MEEAGLEFIFGESVERGVKLVGNKFNFGSLTPTDGPVTTDGDGAMSNFIDAGCDDIDAGWSDTGGGRGCIAAGCER